MHKLRATFILIAIVICITGCSQRNQEIILGNWVGDQASQKIGINEEISQYNYLVITNTEIIMKNFVYLMQDNKMVMKFNNDEKELNYELIKKNQILINNKPYEIDLKKDEMTIKDKNIEIHYKKEGK